MATEMVPIRSIKQYLREFGYEAIVKNNANRGLVKEQIIDAFQKEIFGQIVFKYHDAAILSRPTEQIDEKTRDGVRHILANARWKWKRLCTEFNKYLETRDLIQDDELMTRLKDIVTIQEKERDNPDDIPIEDEAVDIQIKEEQQNDGV